MLGGVRGDIIKRPRLLKGHRARLCFVCGVGAGFMLCVSGRLSGSSLQTFELKLHIH